MVNIALVAAGGAIGSVFRYLVGVWSVRLAGLNFPWGTLAVNVVGSFLIGLLVELVARRLATVPMRLCASPAYLGRSPAIVTLSDLAGHAFLTGCAHRRVGEMTVPTACHPRSIAAVTVLHANDPELLLSLACADRGIALLPAELAAPALESGELVAVLPFVPLADEEVNLVFLPGRRNSRKIRTFVEYLLDVTQDARPASVGQLS